MTAAQTSVDAYHSIPVRTLGRQAQQVMAAIDAGARTRNEIAERSGLRLASVCGRVDELITAGRIYRGLPIRCPITGRRAETLQVMPQQANLWGA